MSKLSLGVERAAKPNRAELAMQGVAFEDTALVLSEGLPFEQWADVGSWLSRADRAVHWWIGDWVRYGERRYGEQYAQAMDATDFEYDTINADQWVARAFEPMRRRTSLSWSHHREVAALEPDEADRLLDQAEAEHWSMRDLRIAVRRSRIQTLASPEFPAGRYQVLLADPPWQYDFVESPNRAIENHYPTLDLDGIVGLTDAAGRPVAELAADDAVLYLWSTSPKLKEAMAVVEGWGFGYVTNLVWVKDRIGMGYWARQRHELLLVATRGDMAPPPEALRPDSVIEAPRGPHSAKPTSVHELIEAVWPDFPKVELFAREARPGWATFGNQVPEVAA